MPTNCARVSHAPCASMGYAPCGSRGGGELGIAEDMVLLNVNLGGQHGYRSVCVHAMFLMQCVCVLCACVFVSAQAPGKPDPLAAGRDWTSYVLEHVAVDC